MVTDALVLAVASLRWIADATNAMSKVAPDASRFHELFDRWDEISGKNGSVMRALLDGQPAPLLDRITSLETGVAAGKRAAATLREMTQAMLRVESAICDDGESPPEAAERLAAAYADSCESERVLLESVRDARQQLTDQQAIHEAEVDRLRTAAEKLHAFVNGMVRE